MSDIVEQLRSINKNYDIARGVHVDIREAADHIEELEAECAAAWDKCEERRVAQGELEAQLAAITTERDAAIPRAYAMGVEDAANTSKEIADQFVGYMSRIERAIRALTPPADLVEQVTSKLKGGE